MTEEELKIRAALDAQQRNSNLRAFPGGAESNLLGQHREHVEAAMQHNARSQEQFIVLCRELLPLGATQINCGMFQVTFERVK